MDRRVDIGKAPFVGGQLPVGMHVPFAQQQQQLFLGEFWIDERERNAVERQVPGGVPGEFPFVRHRDDVGVVEMCPAAVPAVLPLARRLGPAGSPRSQRLTS